MATQIVIANKDGINVDDSFYIRWVDKGNAMPSIPDTIHYIIWNDQPGQNEIQYKDVSTLQMTGNVDLNSVSDAVGDTTIQDLLDWGQTRQGQMEIAIQQCDEAQLQAEADWRDANPGADDSTMPPWTKTWVDYDPNYS